MALVAAPIVSILIIILIVQRVAIMIEGIKTMKWEAADDAKISDFVFKGWSFGRIAKYFGVSRNAVIGRYNRTKRKNSKTA